MSYDLYMFDRVTGEDPEDTLERLADEDDVAAPDPAVSARNRQIADALMAMNPNYTEFEIDHEAITEQMGVAVEEARATHRYIELTDQHGVQITLDDEQASISFPYWDSLDPKQLWDQVAEASKVIGDATGWNLYDPQLGKFIDPVADADEFAEAFGVGVGSVKSIAAADEPPDARGDRPSLLRRILGRR